MCGQSYNIYTKQGTGLQGDLMARMAEYCARKLNAVSDTCLIGVAEQIIFMIVFHVSHFLWPI